MWHITLKCSSLIDQHRCLRPKLVRLTTNTSASSNAEMVFSTAAMTRLAWRYSEREFISSSKPTPLNVGKVSWIFGWVSKSLRINQRIFYDKKRIISWTCSKIKGVLNPRYVILFKRFQKISSYHAYKKFDDVINFNRTVF